MSLSIYPVIRQWWSETVQFSMETMVYPELLVSLLLYNFDKNTHVYVF